MQNRDIVVIGGSAGAIEAVREILRKLPTNLRAAVFVVIHSSPDGPSLLPQVLGRTSNLPVAFGRHDELIQTGRVYVAPPDQHLVIAEGRMHVVRGPRENGFRPAVDPLFRSASRVGRTRVIGVVLSGALNDGTYGAMLVKRNGGLVVIQDPDDALVSSMPASVINNMEVDYVLPVSQIGAVLSRLTLEPAPEPLMSKNLEQNEPGEGENRGVHPEGVNGPPSPYTCPDCGGALWELQSGELFRYQCHIGHGYTAETLAVDQEGRFESAMWTAARVLEQTAALHRRMAERAQRGNLEGVANHYLRRADEADEQGSMIREALMKFREPREVSIHRAG